jgi:hypothetical protein
MGVRRVTQSRGETGAVLILAMVFFLTVSLVVTALMSWVSADLTNTGNFNVARSLDYAASGAAQLEIQNLRYNYIGSTTAPFSCTPGGSFTFDGQAVVVYCSVVLNPASASTRTVTLDACASSQSATCVATPLLLAVVTFDDYSNTNLYGCTSTTKETTCGTGMTVTSWTVQ